MKFGISWLLVVGLACSVVLLALAGCGDFSQRVENAARIAWVDCDRMQVPPPHGCSLWVINWRGKQVSLVLVFQENMRRMFSEHMQRHTMEQFGMRLAQRGASVVESDSAQYQMRIAPFVQGDLIFFRITVVNRAKRPVAHNISSYHREGRWDHLTERVKAELIETMALNAFVRLCAGRPLWGAS